VGKGGSALQARLEDEKQCILLLIGATPEGRKELVGFTDGARGARTSGAIYCSS
jgi:transposase-like protein